MNEKKKGPIAHIVKRPDISLKEATAIRAGAIVLSILVCALVTFLLTGDDPLSVGAFAECIDPSDHLPRDGSGFPDAFLEHRR